MLAPTPRRSALRVRDLSGPIGSVIDGISVDDAITGRTFDTIRGLLTDRHVVFLPAQSTDEGAFEALASQFGSLTVHPLQQLLGRLQRTSIIADTPSHPPAGFPWHTDISWLREPPRFGFLQALDIPARGGDTMWCSLTGAYRSLSPSFQTLLGGLDAVHQIDPSFRDSVVRHHGGEVAGNLATLHPGIRHPLVRSHPDTGEATLFVSPLYTTHVVDVHPAESRLVLGHVDRLLDDPNLSVRWHWSEGDIAIWDESCTVHRALIDHHPLDRRMRRCTVGGGEVGRYVQ